MMRSFRNMTAYSLENHPACVSIVDTTLAQSWMAEMAMPTMNDHSFPLT